LVQYRHLPGTGAPIVALALEGSTIMGKLEGKVAVITGGSTGIGFATAKLFADEGAQVFITGRRQAELEAAVKQIRGAIGVRGDVASLGDLDRLYAEVRTRAGRIDVLFANAGGGSLAPIGDITEEQFDGTFGVNAKGTLFTVQKALPLLTRGASIILNASTAASMGLPTFSVYSATKAAIRSYARSWILDLKDRQVRVNALSPGSTETPGLSGLAANEQQWDEMKKAMAATIPLGRLGTPLEVAKAALFLACDDSSFVNGSELFVDGGQAQV
jgi:NAD(P)-dependent dehydrogenase (short-subunit alcohol dehydrogenase family)